ncbi:hypothetical protein F4778DRAFT_776813 [Xylariomycetidae sp. FL2044]|nr:hypothetical protein F4778DRAFT_776813 [Xylariomycetidae sp. FL2044]
MNAYGNNDEYSATDASRGTTSSYDQRTGGTDNYHSNNTDGYSTTESYGRESSDSSRSSSSLSPTSSPSYREDSTFGVSTSSSSSERRGRDRTPTPDRGLTGASYAGSSRSRRRTDTPSPLHRNPRTSLTSLTSSDYGDSSSRGSGRHGSGGVGNGLLSAALGVDKKPRREVKTQFALSTVLSAAAALAMTSREAAQPFEITEVAAKCTPRGTCTYPTSSCSFTVSGDSGATIANCSASADPLGASALPCIPQRNCDDTTAFEWSVARGQCGLVLNVLMYGSA